MLSNHLILCCPLLLLPSIFSSISQIFTSGGQSIGTSTSASVLPVYIQDWFPLELTGLTSLQFKGLSRVFSKPHFKSINSLVLSFLYVQLSHPYMTTRKTIALTIATFGGKVISPCFNTLSRFVIAFLLRSKHLLISWLQSPPAVIWESPKIKFVTASTFFFLSREFLYREISIQKILSFLLFFQSLKWIFKSKVYNQTSQTGLIPDSTQHTCSPGAEVCVCRCVEASSCGESGVHWLWGHTWWMPLMAQTRVETSLVSSTSFALPRRGDLISGSLPSSPARTLERTHFPSVLQLKNTTVGSVNHHPNPYHN